MPADAASAAFPHFSDPAISAFQSAAASSDARARLGDAPGAIARVDHASAMLQAVARAADVLTGAADPAEAARFGLGSTIDHCAKCYLAVALAEARGDAEAVIKARQALPDFGVCDRRWGEVLTEFMLHYGLTRHGDVPYRRWRSLGDFVLPAPGDPPVLPDDARVAVIGDWGTGAARAQALLEAVAALEPHVVIHLGDIYYSCDAREADAFYRNMRAAFPPGRARLFSLCGNHDMYGGGVPYYALLNRIGQPASFFALRNAHWQLLALDTGYNDFDPFKVDKAETWVQDGSEDGSGSVDDYSELDWHLDKLSNAGGRRTVLLSHHPLFSRHTPIGGRVVNGRLHDQFAGKLEDVALWLWGHEHSQLIYAPFADLERGRCLGSGSIPTLADEDPYAPSADIRPGEKIPGFADDPASRPRVDPATGLYELGFGLLTLAGAGATMTYYAFDDAEGARVAFQEAL